MKYLLALFGIVVISTSVQAADYPYGPDVAYAVRYLNVAERVETYRNGQRLSWVEVVDRDRFGCKLYQTSFTNGRWRACPDRGNFWLFEDTAHRTNRVEIIPLPTNPGCNRFEARLYGSSRPIEARACRGSRPSLWVIQ